MEVTRRSVLLEALDIQEAALSRCSVNGLKLIPLPGLQDEFRAQLEKCRILRELIQGLEAEPVRRELAAWQRDIMDGKKVTVTTLDRVPPIREEPHRF